MSDAATEDGSAARDVLVVAAWWLVVGLLAGVAWWQLAPGIVATRADGGVVLDSTQLERQVGVDGWFALLALGGGLLSGAVLTWWRRSSPALVVVLVVVGALLAGLVAQQLGVLLGPPDPEPLLARRDVGATAPLDLRLQASGLIWAWPACAALGALAVLVVRGPVTTRDHDPQVRTESAPSEPAAG